MNSSSHRSPRGLKPFSFSVGSGDATPSSDNNNHNNNNNNDTNNNKHTSKVNNTTNINNNDKHHHPHHRHRHHHNRNNKLIIIIIMIMIINWDICIYTCITTDSHRNRRRSKPTKTPPKLSIAPRAAYRKSKECHAKCVVLRA